MDIRYSVRILCIILLINIYFAGYNIAIEQNLAWNESSWDDVIQLWFNTGRFFRHEHGLDNTKLHPGDYKPYSQVIEFLNVCSS